MRLAIVILRGDVRKKFVNFIHSYTNIAETDFKTEENTNSLGGWQSNCHYATVRDRTYVMLDGKVLYRTGQGLFNPYIL